MSWSGTAGGFSLLWGGVLFICVCVYVSLNLSLYFFALLFLFLCYYNNDFNNKINDDANLTFVLVFGWMAFETDDFD